MSRPANPEMICLRRAAFASPMEALNLRAQRMRRSENRSVERKEIRNASTGKVRPPHQEVGKVLLCGCGKNPEDPELVGASAT